MKIKASPQYSHRVFQCSVSGDTIIVNGKEYTNDSEDLNEISSESKIVDGEFFLTLRIPYSNHKVESFSKFFSEDYIDFIDGEVRVEDFLI